MPQHPTKNDFLSGFFVFLIALPLCMGIAMASGFPPIAGIFTAIIGGVVSSFLGSSPLTIKGPAAGLIVIALGAVQELGGGDPILGYKRCLAIGVVAALLQILSAELKLGRFAELMPPSIVHGMLAAIGVIIISKQIHLIFGVNPVSREPFQLLTEIPSSFQKLNPEIFLLGGITLLILISFPLLKNKKFKKIPPPLIALGVCIPLALYFDFDHTHHYQILGHLYSVGPEFLVHLPHNLFSAITLPDFSAIFSFSSIKYIVMFSLVGNIESLLTVSAVDSLDPKLRTSNLNKDLRSIGIGNLISSSIGGLPMISEIVRSKANIDNGAESIWSNVFHGLFLLFFVAFFPHLLEHIPLAVLSAMLVYTGFRLASPREFIHTYKMGKDQFILFSSTFILTIFTDLLIGVFCGILLKFLLHLFRGVSFKESLSGNNKVKNENEKSIIQVEGPSVFTNYLSLKSEIDNLKKQSNPIEIDFSKSYLVDLTVQTKLKNLQREVGENKLLIKGLENHKASSSFPSSTKVLPQ